uniref:hypothetical protein n=1 Tax=Shewanella sp. TaxID=50422 RepID=UPI0040475A0E
AAIQAGASLKEIADRFTGYYYRYKRVIMEEIAQVKRAKTEILYNQFNEAFVDLDEHPVVLIIGKSGVGKTAFAKAHFTNPLFVSHIDDLKHLSDVHDGIVFDDMDFKHWPVTSQIHITDYEEGRSINVKHATAYIPCKTRRIFTCNDVPFSCHPAIERRVHRIEFYHNLF